MAEAKSGVLNGDDATISSLAQQAMAKVVANTREKQASAPALKELPQPHVTALALALTDTSHSLAEEMVKDLLDAGLSVQDLCLDHLAPAAREFGTWWKQDKLAFTDVTMATARIQAILRSIPTKFNPFAGMHGHSALFVAVPGETHTLGVIMAADHFRRLGWDVGLLIGMDHAELCRRIAQDDRTIVAMSCAGRHSMPALRHLVDEVRWQRPDVSLVVSGLIAADETALASLPDFDGIVHGFDTALAVMTAVSNRSGPSRAEQDERAQA